MTSQSMTRRSILTGTLGIVAGGLGLSDTDSGAAETTPRRPREKREESWKYIPLDPQKCGQRAYELYGAQGCMYGAVKAGILEYAELLEQENPEQAEICRQFPFLALAYGKGGLGGMKSLCGGMNGAAMFIGLFVNDFAELGALIQKLGEYAETTPLPEFSPIDDQHPDFPKSVSHSVLCKDNVAVWLALDDSQEHQLQRLERCKRYTGSLMAKAVNLLNEHFSREESL